MKKIQPGDGFLTKYPGPLQYAINFVQWARSRDGEATYTHSGLVVSENGTTFEARLKVKEYDLSKYIGSRVLIYRHICMNEKTFQKFYKQLKNESNGKIYPFYRMIFHISPLLSKWAPFDRGVCSEKNAKFNYLCEFMSYWKGVIPDDIHDMVCDPWADQWEIIFEGVLTKENYKELVT